MLNRVLMLMIYSLFDRRVDVILITNKNKTSYDALLIDDYSFIESADSQLDSGLAMRRASIYAIFMSRHVAAW